MGQPLDLLSPRGGHRAWPFVIAIAAAIVLTAVPLLAGGVTGSVRQGQGPPGFGALLPVPRSPEGCGTSCPGPSHVPGSTEAPIGGVSPGPAGSNTTETGNGSSGSAAANGTLRIVGTSYWINYDAGGTYLGPASQSLCLNCPLLTNPNQEFALRFSLTNHDSVARHVSIGNGYVGCGVPFYLERIGLNISSSGQPFVLSPNQSVLVTAYIWPDSAGPGNWTYQGTIETY